MNNNQEINSEVVCIQKHLNQPVILVLLDEKLTSASRLRCGKCMEDYTGPLFAMSYKDAKDKITKYHQSVYQKTIKSLQSQLEQVEILYDRVKTYQNTINANIDCILSSLDVWRKKLLELESSLNQLDIQNEIDNIKQINEQMIQTRVGEVENYLTQLQRAQFQKIDDRFTKMFNLVLLFKSDIININSAKKIEKEIEVYSKITLELKQRYPFQQQCYALAQNKNGTKLVTGQGSDILVWNIQNGVIQEPSVQLNAHSNSVLCLIYSKKIDWFASGSDDCTVKSWLLDNKNQWKCNGKTIVHFGMISGLIMNEKEDELISCSFDKSIRIWKIDQEENKLTVNQALHRHQDHITNINYSQSYKTFASCSKDKTIIIWERNTKEWLFKQMIKLNVLDFPSQVSYLGDDKIIVSFLNLGQISIYKKENSLFIEKSENKIDLLNQDIQSLSYCNIMSNNQKRIIMVQHNKKIIFFHYDKDYILKKMLEMDNNGQSYGSITEEGNNLVIWNKTSNMFHIFSIKYEY